MSPEKKMRLDTDSDFEGDNTQVNKAVLVVTECPYFGKETTVIVHPSSSPENVTVEKNEATIADKLLEIERKLATKITSMVFRGPVSYVYNPIDYAYAVHSKFVYKFCNSVKNVMFLGMNPGPWGMSQTGVPFGEVNIVRDWMGIIGDVGRPERENPSRPVMGFACKRIEVSGQRFWGLFKDLCGDPNNFFQDVIVYNYCPVAFMTESGKNITPSELKVSEREALNTLCDEALYDVLQLLNTNIIVAIGKFCEKRAESLVKTRGLDHIRIECILHPSPRNAGAGNWKETITKKLTDLDLMKYFTGISTCH
ncbi:single-strand selective monofunctional uracil DNA glycosylase [Anabrus simplex]|uniref:single-strand selective monofunctional uracil DNA glycosylase n=1 Tax=Anabrus simplex TaxID=316456 RepID=UPI0035A35C2E